MILDRILVDKRVEVDARKAQMPLENLKRMLRDVPPPRDFASAISSPQPGVGTESNIRNPKSDIRLIAEVKKASPSKGLIRPDFDPVAIANAYEQSGASALSVLTDEKYFQGSLDYLEAIRDAVDLPILRKDFIIDSYQIYEARVAGADAVLLIVAGICNHHLEEFISLAESLGVGALVEAHTADELDMAVGAGAKIIGINNRDLRTFETRLETTLELASRVPADRVLVSESGIFTRADVEQLMTAGVDAVLVGESLIREPDPGVKVRELIGNTP